MARYEKNKRSEKEKIMAFFPLRFFHSPSIFAFRSARYVFFIGGGTFLYAETYYMG
jgi:hypothetical protein